MNDEKILQDDLSLPKALEVEKIIEYYKDIEPEPEEVQEEIDTKKNFFTSFIMRIKQRHTDDVIQSEVYGLSEKGRIILYRCISAAVSVFIIVTAFVLAYFLPGNDKIIKEQLTQLRNEEDYTSLKSRHDALATEVDNLKTTNKSKTKQVNQIKDVDNTKAKLRTDITAKSYELDELNALIKDKRNTIELLDKQIAQKAAPETILPSGKYVVGKNIAAGKYYVTGSGSFSLANALGKSKINTTVTNAPLEVTLEHNDIMKFSGKMKFTSAN